MAYRKTALRSLAIAQMVFGASLFVFGVISFSIAQYWPIYVRFGLLGVGVWVFITGILGYQGTRDYFNPNRCLIGCFMGVSITFCVFSGAMFIYNCITLASYSEMKNLCNRYETYSRGGYNYYSTEYDDCYLRHGFDRDTAEKVAGLGSFLLILSLVELFLALSSSIYCCRAVCCNSAAVENTQVVYVQPQYMYPGVQPGGVLMQTDAGVVPQGYPATDQQPSYVLQQPGVVAQAGAVAEPGVVAKPGVFAQPGVVTQPGMAAQPGVVTKPALVGQPGVVGPPWVVAQPGVVAKPGVMTQPAVVEQPGLIAQPGVVAQPGVAFQQPTYWPVPLGSNAAGAVTLPYSDVPPQVQNQALQVQIPVAVTDEDMPAPYSVEQSDNVPPPAFSSEDANPNS